MKAKKALGQHFLNDENLAANIAGSLAKTDSCPRVLEIGPGRGILTKYLLQYSFHLKAVEVDKDMVHVLTHDFPQIKEDLIHISFLKLDLKKVFGGLPFLMIGNYPYNISTEIVFKMLDNLDLIPEMVGMFQKEVAERFVAPHGSRTYGITSVLIQAYYDGELLYQVPPHSFNPPPKVDSAIIRLTRKEGPLDCNPRFFKQVVKMAFSQRRKMMRNTLKSIVKDPELIQDKVFTLRPEHLSVEDFISLTNKIEKSNES